jgi:hypothetical protein
MRPEQNDFCDLSEREIRRTARGNVFVTGRLHPTGMMREF